MYKNIIILLTLFLGACASTPRSYYSLDHVTAVTAVPTLAQKYDALDLRITSVPVQYDRPQIVIQDQLNKPAVHLLNDSLWLSPLRDQIQSSLSNDVAAYLALPISTNIDSKLQLKKYNVRVSRFDMLLNQGAVLHASWQDLSHGANTKICTAALQTQDLKSDTVSALVNQQKLLLRTLAELISHTNQINSVSLPETVVSYNLGCT